LRNWPPRYIDGETHALVEQEAVSESEVPPAHEPGEAPKRTRVRSLLKPPAADRRRKRGAAQPG
jgi:hypothetical protein